MSNYPRDSSIKPKRGYICGLLSYPFLTAMLGASKSGVLYRFRKYLKRIEKTSQTMSPRELCEFIEEIYESRKRRGRDIREIDPYIWTK